MICLLEIVFFIVLFTFFRVLISKLIGKRAKNSIFNEFSHNYEVSNKGLKIKTDVRYIAIFFAFFLLALLNSYNFFSASIVGGIAVGLVYGVKIIKANACKKQVLQDLLNISECLRVQISSHIPLSNALRSLPELCSNREFQNLIKNIYLEYELSKFIVLDSANDLERRFPYPEIRIFISSLNQQIQGTSALEAFDNLIMILKEKYIEFLEESTKSKMAIMTLGVFLIVLNIAALGIYPIAVEAFNAMNKMLS